MNNPPPGAPFKLTRRSPIGASKLLPRQGFGTQAANALGVTFNSQHAFMAPFFDIQLGFENMDLANPLIFDAIYVAPVAVSLTPGNNQITTWQQVFTDGAPELVIPPGYAGGNGKHVPGCAVTSRLQCDSIPRTDVIGAPRLLRVAAHLAANQGATTHNGSYNATQYAALNNLVAGPGLGQVANPGLINGAYTLNTANAGDMLTVFSSLTQGGNQNPMSVNAGYSIHVISVDDNGDSRTQGSGLGGGLVDFIGPAAYAQFQSYNTDLPLVARNNGTAGMKTRDILNGVRQTINQWMWLPQFSTFPVWSPNDGDTQAIYDDSWACALEFVGYCLSLGVKPILKTCYASSGSTYSRINANNNLARALAASSKGAIGLADFDAFISPNGVFNPLYDSGDLVHANALGCAGQGTVLYAACV